MWAGYFKRVIAWFVLIVERHMISVNWPFLHFIDLPTMVAWKLVGKLGDVHIFTLSF